MSLHQEIAIEAEICEHLAANGWPYSEGDAASYDRARAPLPPDPIAWVGRCQAPRDQASTPGH
jgi:type I restriction enzyme R subunit